LTPAAATRQELPELTPEAFRRGLAAAIARLAARLPERSALPPVSSALAAALFAHYAELRRWAPRLDLVGPGFAGELLERHYAESLIGAALLPGGPGKLLDLGSGAGFPGLVLAAARPDLEVLLLEPRERRWAFLAAAARRAGLRCRCLNARVAAGPAEIPKEIADLSIVTVRALRLEPAAWRALATRMLPGALVLAWSGAADTGAPPAPFAPVDSIRLGGEHRFVRRYRWPGSAGA
jgi:16S rRNA G527 N7-methylase RsmG